ncbi:hypothetical protein DM01DRAFT_1233288 [Hesseltinella vesiculosa]|uniref:Endonuclease/exonuclease/phosphatase domain-containing protein n=1 Tax=Hesseltinella vesiculosa TaxID=101127 RepID=A0A1X2GLC0_9FUNG|nr:hypothetical protein DM01DRAFT_1233288 [Hesseltinella vesiculosa]
MLNTKKKKKKKKGYHSFIGTSHIIGPLIPFIILDCNLRLPYKFSTSITTSLLFLISFSRIKTLLFGLTYSKPCVFHNTLRIATLNTRCLLTNTNCPPKKEFLRYLCKYANHQCDILCIQNTQTEKNNMRSITPRNELTLKGFMNNRSWIAYQHTAILCINPRYRIENTEINEDTRILTADIIESDSGNLVTHILNTYIPPHGPNRTPVIEELKNHRIFSSSPSEPWILCGDLNTHIYDPKARLTSSDRDFLERLHSSFKDLVKLTTDSPDGTAYSPAPTFKSTSNNALSTIDYLFGNEMLCNMVASSGQVYPASQWTDHYMVYVGIRDSKWLFLI